MSDLPRKVVEWLESTGFPLEMEAAAAFRFAGFEVRQSGTYSDPNTEKGREIDIHASDPDLIGAININFVVECKTSPKPWVVLTSADAFSNYNRIQMFAVTSENGRKAIADRLPTFGSLQPYIEQPSSGGYGLRQAFAEKSDAAYTASVNVLSACQSIVRSMEGGARESLTFVFPVIVVDAPIFECVLNDDGRLHVTKVQESSYLFSTYLPEYVGSRITIIQKGLLPQFATRAKELANAMRGEFKVDEDRLLASWR